MDFLQLAKSRCTTRGFQKKAIPAEALDYILACGRVAPTACNKQPQRILVVQKPDGLAKIGKAYQTFDSPCVLVVCRDTREELIRPFDQKCSGDLDIGIICDHMMLAAREKNIGSVMVGLFDPHILRKEFHIPGYIEPTSLLLLGYPHQFPSADRHAQQRLPLHETVWQESCPENMASPND